MLVKLSMKWLTIILFTLFFFSGCNKDHKTNSDFYLKAKVVNTHDFSCGTPVLDFSEDSMAIRAITNRKDVVYSVLALPQNLTVQNQKLYVLVRTLKPEEEFPCLAIGIMYPHLKILEAKER